MLQRKEDKIPEIECIYIGGNVNLADGDATVVVHKTPRKLNDLYEMYEISSVRVNSDLIQAMCQLPVNSTEETVERFAYRVKECMVLTLQSHKDKLISRLDKGIHSAEVCDVLTL